MSDTPVQPLGRACEVEHVEWEEECSGYTPGAYWVYGCEYYAVKIKACVPKKLLDREYWEEEIYNWLEICRALAYEHSEGPDLWL